MMMNYEENSYKVDSDYGNIDDDDNDGNNGNYEKTYC